MVSAPTTVVAALTVTFLPDRAFRDWLRCRPDAYCVMLVNGFVAVSAEAIGAALSEPLGPT